MDILASNLERVRERIDLAARRAGRDPVGVRLVAVTKTHPPEVIRAIRALGVGDIGENRVEEAVPKIEALAEEDIAWHMVGHVQSRKAAEVASRFDWVQSVDTARLAQRLDRFAGEAGRRLKVLLQFNVSGEASKEGWPAHDSAAWNALLPEVEAVLARTNLDVRGVMTIARPAAEPEMARPDFRRLRQLRDFLRERFTATDWTELSMGMTDDYEVAVEEGATLVRIGRALFGERPTAAPQSEGRSTPWLTR